MALHMKRSQHTSRGQFVRAVILTKGIPFYGFHSGYSPFLKIILTTPDKVSLAMMILQSGSVLGTKMNIHEGHLSYPLQFMCDFNLYGCGWMEMRDVHFRRNPDEGETSDT